VRCGGLDQIPTSYIDISAPSPCVRTLALRTPKNGGEGKVWYGATNTHPERPMHKGVIFATLLVALIVAGVGVYMVLDPMLVRSYAVTLRNPTTGEQVICQASYAPGFVPGGSPEIAVSTCAGRCGAKGFRQTGGNTRLVVDYVSAAAARRAQDRYNALTPAACKT